MKIRAYTKDNERLNERQSARVFFSPRLHPHTFVRFAWGNLTAGAPAGDFAISACCTPACRAYRKGWRERNMGILELGSLQLTLFAMMLVGVLYTSIF